VAYDPLLGVRPGHCGVPLTLQFLGSWGGNFYHCGSNYPPDTSEDNLKKLVLKIRA